MTPLRQRMLEDMRIRTLSTETQTSYINHVARFAWYCRQSPERVGPEEIWTYQLYLINERQLAPTSVAGAVAALRFLYQTTLHRPGRWMPSRRRSGMTRCPSCSAPRRWCAFSVR